MNGTREDSSQSELIVKLNFGGTKFMTSRETLLSSKKDNFFKSLLEGKIPSTKDEEGFFFIDRNGRVSFFLFIFFEQMVVQQTDAFFFKYFEPILDYLRTGVLYIPKDLSQKLVEELARFLIIDLDTTYISGWLIFHIFSIIISQIFSKPIFGQ